MAVVRILGVDLPQNKRVGIALQYIKGIGSFRSNVIVKDLELPVAVRVKDLTEQQVSAITQHIKAKGELDEDSNPWFVEGALRRKLASDIGLLKHVRSYRGVRHGKLPVRGQRTKSNARNAKGKAGATGISNRKKKK